jgi:hypothetical protein
MRPSYLSPLAPCLNVGDELGHSPFRLLATPGRRLFGKHSDKKLAGLAALMALLLVKTATKLGGRHVFYSARHVSEEQVREAIDRYVEGRSSLEELDTWLTTRTWDDRNAPALAHEAGLLIAEAAYGHRDDLAEDLRALVANKVHQHA